MVVIMVGGDETLSWRRQAVFHATPEGRLVKEIGPTLTIAHLKAISGGDFIVSSDLCGYRLK